MAEQDQSSADRTEEPTPERLRRAREQGQVPQSKEVPSALLLLVLLLLMAALAPMLYEYFHTLITDSLTFDRVGPNTSDAFMQVFRDKSRATMLMLVPFLVVGMAVSALSSVLVGGWAFSPKGIRLNLNQINPVRGFKQLFSLKSVMNLVVSVLKLTLVLVLVYSFVRGKLDEIVALEWTTAEGLLVAISRLVFSLVIRIVAGLLLIAGIDWLYQKWNYKRQLRMTRREIKEERKQYEVSPEYRGRIRQVQMSMARKRMLQSVPDADVVVTNPEHVAVALKYDSDEMEAPQVVAKGADLLAGRIREIARAHDVPIVRRPELARTLYAGCEVGEFVPETLYLAVAEVLATIYRLRRKAPSNAR
ncbi:MAG: flagellar biosynthesis protein FlhB [Phycisphaerae bacterium]